MALLVIRMISNVARLLPVNQGFSWLVKMMPLLGHWIPRPGAGRRNLNAA